MGFLFRLCFWLGVTLAIMPPEERPGEALAGMPAADSLEQRFASTVQSAWTLVSQISTACEDNPQLCAATSALAQTAVQTGETLAADLKTGLEHASPAKLAPNIELRVPLPDDNYDGRVGRGQSPAG